MQNELGKNIETTVKETAAVTANKGVKEGESAIDVSKLVTAISSVGENYEKTIKSVMGEFSERLSKATNPKEIMEELAKIKAQNEARYEELIRKLTVVTVDGLKALEARFPASKGVITDVQAGFVDLGKAGRFPLFNLFVTLAVLRSSGIFIEESAEDLAEPSYIDMFFRSNGDRILQVPARPWKLTEKMTKTFHVSELVAVASYDANGVKLNEYRFHNKSVVADLSVIPKEQLDYTLEEAKGKQTGDTIKLLAVGTGYLIVEYNKSVQFQTGFNLTALVSVVISTVATSAVGGWAGVATALVGQPFWDHFNKTAASAFINTTGRK